MRIWEHSDRLPPELNLVLATRKHCAYCNAELKPHYPKWEWARHNGKDVACIDTVSVCRVCGWWLAERQAEGDIVTDDLGGHSGTYGTLLLAACGALKNLDLRDISLPIKEVRSFLAARYEKRFDIHPRLMEETVGSVFSDLGYSAIVTGYSGDDGIDVILSDGSPGLIGVQVKRYKGRITVEQIRSLAGALVLGGYTSGVFVTTSSFQSGSDRTTNRFTERGVPMQLIDAPGFFQLLCLAQIEAYDKIPEDQLPFAAPPTTHIATSYYSCSNSTGFYALPAPKPAPWS